MSIIHVLRPNVANRIAAGEVVERPLSIVKELVENALDAGATSVSIEIENGGIDLIRVSDNGKGISFEDCPTAFLRHATSKITDSEDIRHIETLGFRGEALASIASVSEVTLKTREQDADEGTLYRIDNGSETEHTQTACTEGTVIEVKNLFSKVPARLKFLKASRTEAGYIGDYVSRMILCYPAISFSFVNNGKNVYRTYGNTELKDSIYRIYGADTLSEIIPVEYDDGYVHINGFIGTPALAKPNRSYQTIFVNGRYIKDFKLAAAALRAYDTRMLIGKFPFFVVNMFLSPFEVDINVHPQKMEVRFADEMRVANAMYSAVFRALNGERGEQRHEEEKVETGTDIPENTSAGQNTSEPDDLERTACIGPDVVKSSLLPGLGAPHADVSVVPHVLREQAASVHSGISSPGGFPLQGFGTSFIRKDTPSGSSIPVFDLRKKAEPLPVFNEKESAFPRDFKFIGTCFNGYVIVEASDQIIVIDQHAAHERMLYEQMRSGEVPVASQKLLFPQTLRLTHVEMDTLQNNVQQFTSLGFDFDVDADSNEVSVKSVPILNGVQIPAGAVYEALQIISEKGDVDKNDFVRSAIIQSSCKHAVKVTEILDDREITALLDAYSTGDIPLTCPHGRPVFIAITQRDLEKRFKRIQ